MFTDILEDDPRLDNNNGLGQEQCLQCLNLTYLEEEEEGKIPRLNNLTYLEEEEEGKIPRLNNLTYQEEDLIWSILTTSQKMSLTIHLLLLCRADLTTLFLILKHQRW